MASYTNLKKIKEKDGEALFEAELAADVLAKSEEEVLREAGSDLALPGFRKGKVPTAMVRERMDPIDILEEASRKALPDAIRGIVAEHKLSILGQPEIAIVKLAPGNPVVFTARFALAPEIDLPDYRSVAQKIVHARKPAEVSAEEVDEAIRNLLDMFKGEKGGPVPELTDDFVKQFGPYKDVAAFKDDMKRSLTEGKEREAKEQMREEIVRAITAKTKIKVPKLLIDQELTAFFERRDEELERSGISFDDYLKQLKKTKEELENEERAAIEQQIAASLVMGALRKAEQIVADKDDVSANLAALARRYPDRTEAELWEPAEAIATQKKLFDILEGAEKSPDIKEEREKPAE